MRAAPTAVAAAPLMRSLRGSFAMSCLTFSGWDASAAERGLAHGRFDATEHHLLEVFGAGERAVGEERPRVVTHGGHPGAATVVVLAPGDGVEVAVAGVPGGPP